MQYLKPNRFAKEKASEFVRADWSRLLDGNYLVFPRDGDLLPMIFDGRWEFPPSPVTWAFTRYLAAPISIRRHAEAGLTAVLMAPPEDCFAVSVPYNKEPPDNVAAHGSVYLSLFGRDVAAGQTVTAHCRLIIAKDLSDEVILQRYQGYLEGRGVEVDWELRSRKRPGFFAGRFRVDSTMVDASLSGSARLRQRSHAGGGIFFGRE